MHRAFRASPFFALRVALIMRKSIVIAAIFAAGCTISKEAQVKCPKCGAVFTVNEGLEEFQRTGRSGTGR